MTVSIMATEQVVDVILAVVEPEATEPEPDPWSAHSGGRLHGSRGSVPTMARGWLGEPVRRRTRRPAQAFPSQFGYGLT